jgi:hypothetical protein
MCKALFGRLPAGAEDTPRAVEALVRGLADADEPDDFVRLNRAEFDFIAQHVDKVERDFEQDFWDAIIKPLNPNISSWEELRARPDLLRALEAAMKTPVLKIAFSRMLVLKAADALGISPTARQVDDRTRWLVAYLSVPMALYHLVVRRVAGQGARLNKSERRNWIWDLYILFGIGDDHAANDLPLTLVSSDKDMAAAANTAGFAKFVVSFPDYLARLGINWAA